MDEELKNVEGQEVEATVDETAGEAVAQTDAEKLAEAELQIADLKNQILYKVAEFENYRKHAIREKSELVAQGGSTLMKALLPVLDDFDRAKEHIEKATDVEGLKEGVELIMQKLIETLQKQGLEEIDAKDKAFDTDYHEAVTLFPTNDESQKGCVIDCVQKGYTLNGKVLRHAKVVVGG